MLGSFPSGPARQTPGVYVGCLDYSYLTEGVKDVIEVYQDLALCDFCDVIHGLAGIIADTGILVGEASQHRRDNLGEIVGQFLPSDR